MSSSFFQTKYVSLTKKVFFNKNILAKAYPHRYIFQSLIWAHEMFNKPINHRKLSCPEIVILDWDVFCNWRYPFKQTDDLYQEIVSAEQTISLKLEYVPYATSVIYSPSYDIFLSQVAISLVICKIPLYQLTGILKWSHWVLNL